MAQDVEQYDAISVMLRNISFGFLLFSILLGVQGLFSSYAAPLFILLGFLCLFLSIMLIKEAVKYQTYFFRSIYQSVVALLVKPEQLSIRFQEKGILNHNPSIHEK